MKNKILMIIGGIIASLLVTTSVFAATNTTHKYRGTGQRTYSGALAHSGSLARWSHSGALNFRSGSGRIDMTKVTRMVTNVSNGVQITETTTDATTLALLNDMFTKWQANPPKNPNPLITTTRTQLSDGMQTTITSTDAATVTKIQANGGSFGKMETGKKPTVKKNTKKTPIKKYTVKKTPIKKYTVKKTKIKRTGTGSRY